MVRPYAPEVSCVDFPLGVLKTDRVFSAKTNDVELLVTVILSDGLENPMDRNNEEKGAW